MAIFDDTRSDWNARPPTRPRTSVAWSDRIGVSWHWIGPGRGPSASGSHQKCLDRIREWQLFHQTDPARRWKDLGYNALICQHARALEGRGLEFSGSHSPGVNTAHIGVQFMVGEDDEPPTPAMLARAVRLRADIGALGKNIRRDWSHRDDPEASTGCAGDWITNWVHSDGPTKNAPTEDEVTPQDIKAIAEAVLTANVIPAKMLGEREQLINVPRMGDLLLRWVLEARDNGVVARRLAEQQALLGRPMTKDEVSAAVKAALSEAAQIEVVVKPQPQES